MELVLLAALVAIFGPLLGRCLAGGEPAAGTSQPGEGFTRVVGSGGNSFGSDSTCDTGFGASWMSSDDDTFGGSSVASSNDDWLTNPIYSYMPGNIYHHEDSTCCGCSTTGSDWMTDPTCSYLPGNIFHDDDLSCGSLFTDDSFSVGSGSSLFDSDLSSSFSDSCPTSMHDD